MTSGQPVDRTVPSDGLCSEDIELMRRIEAGLSITADISRADLFLYQRTSLGVRVVAQARPHSISSLYPVTHVDRGLSASELPLVLRALGDGRAGTSQYDLPSGTPIVQEVFPVAGQQGHIIGALGVETNLIAHERHRRRHRSFQRAVRWVEGMAIGGELASGAHLSSFGEWDGIVYVDAQRRIAYLSGIAHNLYRRLGYLVDLRGALLGDLSTGDERLVRLAMETGRCAEEERQEGRRLWNRKVVPVYPREPTRARSWHAPWQPSPNQVAGALIMVRDLTEERFKEHELQLKATMIQEVHHRVKNNLQSVASLLRMQARRIENKQASEALNDAVTRILSVAVIHEFLSQSDDQLINIRDVCQRIVAQVEAVSLTSGSGVQFDTSGPSIYLPSRQATAAALVVNELLENALEHGNPDQPRQSVCLTLFDGGDEVSIRVQDDAGRLPEGFDIDDGSGLGLRIVRTLVEEELEGHFELQAEDGVAAAITFPKRSALRDEPRLS